MADPIVDMCMECGFESNCPSRDVSLTPRQRITVYREISRLQAMGANAEIKRDWTSFWTFSLAGDSTCAADGMCEVKCPVGINTGAQKSIRARELEQERFFGRRVAREKLATSLTSSPF